MSKRKYKINLEVRLGDKVMLQQACIDAEFMSLSALVRHVIMVDIGYEMVAGHMSRKKHVPLSKLDLIKHFPAGDFAYYSWRLLCIEVSFEEAAVIKEYATLNRYRGIPSYVLGLLREYGFIAPEDLKKVGIVEEMVSKSAFVDGELSEEKA